MASWIRAVLTSTLLAFCIATPSAQAAPAPIVFDFEDGLQGWTVNGSAQRVQTQILGGTWAIFGDGLFEFLLPPGQFPADDPTTYVAFEIDVTQIARMSVDFFFAGSPPDPGDFIHAGHISRGGVFAAITFPRVEEGNSTANPRTLEWDLSGFGDVIDVGVFWTTFNRDELASDARLAFIDNITFHPVPEPSTLALLVVSLAALGMCRRRIV